MKKCCVVLVLGLLVSFGDVYAAYIEVYESGPVYVESVYANEAGSPYVEFVQSVNTGDRPY